MRLPRCARGHAIAAEQAVGKDAVARPSGAAVERTQAQDEALAALRRDPSIGQSVTGQSLPKCEQRFHPRWNVLVRGDDESGRLLEVGTFDEGKLRTAAWAEQDVPFVALDAFTPCRRPGRTRGGRL